MSNPEEPKKENPSKISEMTEKELKQFLNCLFRPLWEVVQKNDDIHFFVMAMFKESDANSPLDTEKKTCILASTTCDNLLFVTLCLQDHVNDLRREINEKEQKDKADNSGGTGVPELQPPE